MKGKKIIFVIGLMTLVGIYLFLRIFKFEEKTAFGLDQGFQLLETWEMVTNKDIRLIGPMVTSKTFLDRGFFIGPQYYYVLAIFGQLTRWNPILISLSFLFIELIFFVYFVNWIRKKYGVVEALTIFGLISFSKYFIMHSRFFWNPHFLLPLGIMAVVALDKYVQTEKIKYILGFGILWGLAFGFHYSSVLWAIPLLIVLLKNKKLLNWKILIVSLFFVIGDLPWFIFEIRNNFYNIKTVFLVMGQTLGKEHLELYYFTHSLGIFIFWGLAWILNKIKKGKLLVCLVMIIGVSLIQMRLLNYPLPYKSPKGWNYLRQKEAVNKILINGCPENYNITSTLTGDTRSYDLRFLLIIKGCKPMGVEEYPKAKTLFLVAPVDRPPEIETVWEVNSFGKFEVKREESLNENIRFYELEKL